jgi:hypothetical protein
MSTKCMFIVKEATDTTKGASGMFKVKGTYLTRINAAGQYEKFTQPRDQFPFGNDDIWMWPKSWWKQFNYVTSIDPVTGTFYPFDSMYPFRAAADSNFSDWPNFVKAFGIDQCYWLPTRNGYKDKALTKWESLKGEWGGPCFGIAIAALMAFDDKDRFLNAFPQIPSFSTLNGVGCTDSVRLIINQLFLYQFGATHKAYSNARWSSITPTQTIQELRSDFLNDTRDVKVLNIYRQTGTPAGHSIVAYKLEHDTLNSKIFWISVYDNSHSTDYNARIQVDTVADTWDYSNWPDWGGPNKGLMLMDPVSGYYAYDTLNLEVSSIGSPVITGGKQRLTSSKYWELYSSSKSSIIIKDPQGNRIGFQDQKFFNEIPGAGPMISLDSREAPPIGYLLPPGRYSVTLGEAVDSIISFSLLSDSSVMTYQHNGVKALQTDQLEINDHRSMRIINNDSESKKIDMKIVVEELNAEKIFRLRNFDMLQGDSVSVAAIVNEQLQLSHTGTSPTKFDIRIEHNSKEGLELFSKTEIQLDKNSGYTFVPNWNDFSTDTTMKILIDHGNDGTIDDSLKVKNDPTTSVHNYTSVIPSEFKLSQNYPNPFNPLTMISYQIPTNNLATLKVFDALGREVATLVNEIKEAGSYSVQFDGSKLSSGMYFYRLQAGSFSETKKLILLR